MDKIVKIACRGADVKDISDLHDFQGELKSLSKENYEKLKGEITSTGFAFPVNVWIDPDNGKHYIVGGHQRTKTLTQMRLDGWEVPPIPIAIIEAEDFFAAKRRVLQDVAQYGHVEREGLYAFMSQSDIEFNDLQSSFDIPMISMDMGKFEAEYFKELDTTTVSEHEREISEEKSPADKWHQCPKCGHRWNPKS